MDQGQTSGDGGRPQTDYQTPPESQTELPATLRPPSSCWSKREHDGRAEAPCKSQRTSCNAIEATVVLDDTQRKVLEELVTRVDAKASVVITNPRAKGAASPSPAVAWPTDHLAPPLPPGRVLCPASPSRALRFAPGCAAASFPGCGNTAPAAAALLTHRCCAVADNPIVYVTEPWQTMCGFTYEEASGQNPRIVQGERTDQKVVRAISGALANQSACKVQFVNYRRGSVDKPFWNMLSISPVLHQGNVMFYMANLQDYSYHMAQMVSLTPSQFCRVAQHHQRGRRLQMLDDVSGCAKPAIYETDLEFPVPSQGKTTAVAATPQPIKRLGWNDLVLEPEHLSERLKDALQTMGASYELHICGDQEGEIFVLHAKIDQIACRLTVSEDPADGTQRISVTRLGGDTFEYHKAFRQLREHLGEACTLTRPLLQQGGRPEVAIAMSTGAQPSPWPRPAGVDPLVLPQAPACAPGTS